MANNIKTVFLDFYGLPGSGKTTVSHLIAKELRKKGKKVAEPTYYFDHKVTTRKRKAIKVCISFVYLLFHPWKSIKVEKLVKRNKYNIFSGLSQFINITVKLLICDILDKKYDFIIFDEGICQAAISLTVNSEITSQMNVSEIKQLFSKDIFWIAVYIKEDLFTTLKRLEKRDGRDSRIEREMDKRVRAKMLKTYENACEDLVFLDKILINTEKETFDKVEIIMQELEKRVEQYKSYE